MLPRQNSLARPRRPGRESLRMSATSVDCWGDGARHSARAQRRLFPAHRGGRGGRPRAIECSSHECHTEFAEWYDADFDPMIVDLVVTERDIAGLAKPNADRARPGSARSPGRSRKGKFTAVRMNRHRKTVRGGCIAAHLVGGVVQVAPNDPPDQLRLQALPLISITSVGSRLS